MQDLDNPISIILEALEFASIKHKDQRRKDAEASPYINHPIALAKVLSVEGGIHDPAVICGALLHDTIEDTETTEDELRARFGGEITKIVLEVTDDKSLPKAERKRQQIIHAGHASNKAKLVKLADKISNLRDILNQPPTDWTLQRKQEYFDWAKAVVDQVGGASEPLAAIFDEIYARRPVE